jgi:hypothetical protein
MIIKLEHRPLNNEKWCHAIATLSSGQIAVGYGTSFDTALKDCFRDIELIIKLNKQHGKLLSFPY